MGTTCGDRLWMGLSECHVNLYCVRLFWVAIRQHLQLSTVRVDTWNCTFAGRYAEEEYMTTAWS